MMVSFSVSPFDWLLVLASLKPITLPPRRFTAVSKLRRVRVDGSKNSEPTTLPSRMFWLGFFSNSLARRNSDRISSFVKSVMEIKLRFCILLWVLFAKVVKIL